MIVIFGASSETGRRVASKLLDDGSAVRLVSRDVSTLDPRAERVAGDISIARAACKGADVVVSFAPARFTAALLGSLPAETRDVVLTGSAWRDSHVPNSRADDVRSAETTFMASGRDGVMLHPTLIYGGGQRPGLNPVFAAVRFHVVPVPGGGRNLVQPIHVDDLAACFVAAIGRHWTGPNVMTVAGPQPIRWVDMARTCARKLERGCIFVPVPLGPAIQLLNATERLGLELPIRSSMLERFRENVSYSVERMRTELGVTPRPFSP